jgi:hypothetical protein
MRWFFVDLHPDLVAGKVQQVDDLVGSFILILILLPNLLVVVVRNLVRLQLCA